MSLSLPFLVRRGVTQATLLVAVLAVVVAGTVLLGTCALLLTTGQEAALDAALQRVDPQDVEVEVAFRMAAVTDSRAAVADATDVLDDALAPLDPVISRWLTSAMRPLSVDGTVDAYGYVVGADDLTEHAELEEGRWPVAPVGDGPIEVAVPGNVADRLGLEIGSDVVLEESQDGTVREPGPGVGPVTLVVVGVFTPVRDTIGTWDRDQLRGVGVDATWELRTARLQPPVTAYGPFVAAPDALLDSAVALDRAVILARPDLTGTTARERDAVRSALRTALPAVRAVLGERTSLERLTTGLRRTIAQAEVQQRVTGSSVLVVALLGAVLAAAALALAGRLVRVRRNAEARLLAARGANRAQLVGQAATESLVLAVMAAALAVPIAGTLYRWLSGLPPMAAAGLTSRVGTTPTVVVTVAIGALALAVVLVAPSLQAPDRQPRTRRSVRGRVARSTTDVVLVGLAVVGYLQLRGRPFREGGGPDPLLVAAPMLCLVAGAVVALRVVPWAARWAERRARRSRRLVLPLASWEISRRSHSTGAALLLVLAAASATFGVSLSATWSASATDQADAQVGTDLSVGLTATTSPLAQARALAAVTGARVTPATDRDVTLAPPGNADTATPDTSLVAVDTTRDAELLRGRLPAGTTWAGLTAGLAPADPVAGIAIPPDAESIRLTVSGALADPLPGEPELSIIPAVVVETTGGGREALSGWAVPLDGQPHDVVLPLPSPGDGVPGAGDVRVVAVMMSISLDLFADFDLMPRDSTQLTLTAVVGTSGSSATTLTSGAQWSPTVPKAAIEQMTAPSDVDVVASDGDVSLTVTTELYPFGLFVGTGKLVLTGFPPPTEVPVLVTSDLARTIAAQVGDALSLDVGSVTLTARVAGIAPDLASIPHGANILADHDALSRAALVQASLDSLTDRWWLGGVDDPAAAAYAITDRGLGDPLTREALADQLRDDPLRIGLQVSLWLLVAAAGILAVAGTVVQTAAALEARAVDVARLQGMGVPRRAVVAALLVEHGVVSLLVVVAGGVVGAVAAWTVGPLLVVSASGQAPVPSPVPQWSWPVQGALLGALLVACAVVVVPVATSLVRRATAAHLRMEGGS